MRIGIYSRKDDPKLPSLNWLEDHGFDSFEIYPETVIDEYEDIFQREQLNMMLYDIEMGHLDAVYVDVLKIISPITVKVFQVLIEVQKLNVPIFFRVGKVEPSDESIRHFNELFISQWDKFRKDSDNINFDVLLKDPSDE
jgi:hypothetical protein